MPGVIEFTDSPLLGMVHETRRENVVSAKIVVSDVENLTYQLQISVIPEASPAVPLLHLFGSLSFRVTQGPVGIASLAAGLYGTHKIPAKTSLVPGEITRPSYLTKKLGAVVVGPPYFSLAKVDARADRFGSQTSFVTEGLGLYGDLSINGSSYFAAPVLLQPGVHRIDWTLHFRSVDLPTELSLQPILTFTDATPGSSRSGGQVFGGRNVDVTQTGVNEAYFVSASALMKFELFPLARRGDQVALRIPVDRSFGSTVFHEGGMYQILNIAQGSQFGYVNFRGTPETTAGVDVYVDPYPLSLGTEEERIVRSVSVGATLESVSYPRDAFYLPEGILTVIELSFTIGNPFIGAYDVRATFTDFGALRKFLGRQVASIEKTPTRLERGLVNPLSVPGQIYAIELMVLNLNLLLRPNLLVVSGLPLGDLIYLPEGRSIYQVANQANAWIAGGEGLPVPYETLKSINESFVGGVASRWALDNLSTP